LSEKNRVVVVGGGHNGLVCAAYLAKAGVPVVVLEQKKVVGGCVVTEEVAPGWRINTYSFEHYAIQNTPILSDLSLESFGLQYYTVDPAVFCPFPDRKYMLLYRELEKTIKHIETLSKKDARTYQRFHEKWAKVGKAIGEGVLQGPPSSLQSMLSNSGLFRGQDEVSEIVEESKLPMSNILSENFETEYIPALIAFLGPAAIGLSPSAPYTGWLSAWHIGAERVARPKGGSGELTRALADSAKASGATILENERVTEIIVSSGRATGVKTERGKVFESTIVVSNVDPKQTILKLARGGDTLPSDEYRKVEAIKVTPGFAFKADYLLSDLPDYLCKPLDRNRAPNELHKAATFIAPSVESLATAYSEFSNSRNPKLPGLMVALHSTTDSSLAPDGKQSLILETRFTPYKLFGLSWTEEDKENETEKLLSIYSKYCPGVEDLVEEKLAKSPQDMERDVLVPQGNFMHVDMKFDQMFDNRPAPGLLNGYEVASIPNLFLCGAGTFPGGGVSGIPGRNSALQIIEKLRNA